MLKVFSPHCFLVVGASRNTSVVVVTLETSEVYIIVSLSSRSDTQVIYIDPTSGALRFAGKLGVDVFTSENEAFDHITNASKWQCRSTTHARAILGYAALGSYGLLLVATKLTSSIPHLPGGGCVYTVTESQWIKILLQNPHHQGKGELKNVQELTELDIDGKHYFCETVDITRPFPSHMSLENPDDEFVWNGWLSMPFKNVGLPQHCVILLQGFAECRKFGSLGQLEGIVALTARRSRLHPGTRYLARGLNSCFSTGNEVECEQLVWVPKKSAQSVPFNTYIWRRGTIPIWWGAELKMTAAEAEIYVSDRSPYKGSLDYYNRLSKRYDARNLDVGLGEGQKKKAFVPIVCINLLRNGEGKSESILVQHFEESLNYIRSTRKLLHARIHLINYDWHASTKLKGEQRTVEELWKLLEAPTMAIGISEGDYLPSRQRLSECKGEIICSDNYVGAFCLRTHQNGVIRFNCADSLDRTNAASYFGALQVFVEQCRRLAISLDSDLAYGHLSPSNYGGYTAPLPLGWEKRSDAVTGKAYYIDHNTRTTTWSHPCPDKPWKRFQMSFEEFKRSTILSPVSLLADLFLLAGDIHATLYTGSKAMHSQILSIFNEEVSKFKQLSAAQNMKITLQRRYKNAVVDSSRQKQLEMFLGIRLFKHLPSIPIQPLNVPSRPTGFFLKPVTNISRSSTDASVLLSFKRKNLTWVTQQDADVVELFIYLGEPCHVCQLLLTVSHGADDSTCPSTVDVRTGRSLDGLKLVVEGASVPHCANGTNLLVSLPGPISSEDMAITGAGARLHAQDTSNLSLLYEFEEVEGKLDFLTRVVAVTFYPAISGNGPMTIGEIEILGVSLPWRSIFDNEGPGVRILQLPKQVQKEANPFISDSGTNPLSRETSYDSAVPPSSEQNASGNWIDLLSGEDSISVPHPLAENYGTGGSDLLDFLGEATNEKHDVKIEHDISTLQLAKCISGGGTEKYIDCLKFLEGPQMGRKLDYVEAMKLEIERLRLNLSAAERDRALLSVGIDPASINPNALIDASYIGILFRVAKTLAVLAQVSHEDKINAAIGLGNENDEIIDFWNVSGMGECCSGGKCEVHAEKGTFDHRSPVLSSTGNEQSIFLCSQCKKKACKVCCAGKGALLLASYNSMDASYYNGLASGTSYGSQADSAANRVVPLDGVICKRCCHKIVLDALLVDYVRVLITLRRKDRADNAACQALDQVLGSSYKICKVTSTARSVPKLLSGEESLAEFPFASFLHPVETAKDSAPFLSLLAPVNPGLQDSYWKAPPSTNSVDFIIVLGTLSDVSGIILLVSPCGYSAADAPSVQVWASNKLENEERSCVGKWDIQSMATSSSELYGPERVEAEGEVPRHVKFSFKNNVRCRIIWITLRLPRAGSSSVNIQKDFNLLSLDENPFAEVDRRASFGGGPESLPCLHARRILVLGKSVRKEAGHAEQSTDAVNFNGWLDRPPQLNRFKVPIEVERLIDSDLTLEQYLPPASPLLGGFRLDAFSAIKPQVIHSPSSNGDRWNNTSATFLEGRHISPAVLYIQVTAIQEPNKLVTIGEFRLPEAKAGTAMYFDFPRQMQTRRVTFRLLGDIGAFTDDPAESDDSGTRTLPVAAGLSLSNRIKLYYYADPYELGKWASLSVI
ncbi:Probable phosphoinositide phosphatase SAC9 [Linum perenne]